MTKITTVIHLEQKGFLLDRVNKMNKIALKINVKPIQVNFGEVFQKEVELVSKNDFGFIISKVWESFVNVEIEYSPIRIDGWAFVAKVDNDGHSKSIFRRIPGTVDIEIPEHFNEIDYKLCEHCNTKRERKGVAIIYNEITKEFKQVGYSCLKHFMGHSINKVFSFYEKLAECDSDDSIFHLPPITPIPNYDVKEMVPFIVQMIRSRGFVSTSKSSDTGQTSTKDMVLEDFHKIINGKRPVHLNVNEFKKNYESTLEYSKKILNFLNKYMDENELTEEYWNVSKIIIKDGFFTIKQTGYIVSLVAWAIREIDNPKEKKEKTISDYVGNIGSKYQTSVKVCHVSSNFDMYGKLKYFVIAEDLKGNHIVFGSSKPIFNVGEIVKIEGTIKDHKMYREEKQTIMIRVKPLKK